MSEYSISAFENAQKIPNYLAKDSVDAYNITNSINSFVNDQELKGPSWDKAKEKISEYTAILATRKNLANEIENTINSVNSNLKAAFGTESYINVDSLEEIEAALIAAKNNLASLAEDNTIEIEMAKSNIARLENTMGKIRYFKEQINAAIASLEKLESIVNDYSMSIESINPSSVITYGQF